MTRIYNILRALFVTVFALAIIGPLVLYLVLSVSGVQRGVGDIAENELSELLGADVEIGEVDFAPFNKLTLKNVVVRDSLNDTILNADRIGAGIVMSKLLVKRRLIFSYAEILGLNVSLWRDSIGAPLNIQPIIDRLSSKDKNKPSAQYDLRINNIVIRKAGIEYDVLSEPHLNRFDKNHIKVTDVKADIFLPEIRNDNYRIDLKRIALKERSGLYVESLSGKIAITDTLVTVDDFDLKLSESRIALGPIALRCSSLKNLGKEIFDIPINFEILPESRISTYDAAPFVPQLGSQWVTLALSGKMSGRVSDIDVHSLSAHTANGGFGFHIKGNVSGLPDVGNLEVKLPEIELAVKPSHYLPLIMSFVGDNSNVQGLISRAGDLHYKGIFDGRLNEAVCDGHLETSIGAVDIDASYRLDTVTAGRYLLGNIMIDSFDLGRLLDKSELGTLSANIDADAVFKGNDVSGDFDINLDRFVFKDYEYGNATFQGRVDKRRVDGAFTVDDENVKIKLDGWADFSEKMLTCDVEGYVRDFNPHALHLLNSYPGYSLATDIDVKIKGPDPDHADGKAELSRLSFKDASGNGVGLSHLTFLASGSTSPQFIVLRSDIFEGQLSGHYRFKDIIPAGKQFAASIFPALVPVDRNDQVSEHPVELSLNFELRENDVTNKWLEFFKSPVKVLHPVTIESALNTESRNMRLTVDAPYLLKKDKFIDKTSLQVNVDGEEGAADVLFTTLYPTKNGGATLEVTAHGHNDVLESQISWDIDSKRRFDGMIGLSALFKECKFGGIDVKVGIEKSHFVINDTAWVVQPASIDIAHGKIHVNDIDVGRSGQFIKIGGVVSDDPDDVLILNLNDMSLDYVFETLAIGNVDFGGTATGDFYARNLLSKEPRLDTPNLHVKRFCYNKSLLGDADIVSRWDNEQKGVTIDADILQPNGRRSTVNGIIYPMAEALDFRFKADKLNVGFMKPYMEAFTSSVSGYASGEARLFGTFKLIDMTGEIYAEDLKLKLDITNTYYSTTDSIHLTPGRIEFGNVTLYDEYGNKAKLDGWVTHKCFKEPEFEFRVSNARNFLCFDVNNTINPVWFGRIFCNGMALIKGVPGFIDVNVDISTAAKSEFNFVLSDTEAASEYTFMSFNDRDAVKGDLLLSVEDPRAASIKRLKEHYERLRQEENTPSVYRVNLQVEANPNGEMVLVLDPEGGDQMKARGNGNLRIEYNSSNDDMLMYGTYTLTQGDYNFTLQDIIIKDFTIKPGSSIAFHGDPLDAVLDIQAVYSVNANLSDLDESFLQDRELTRTNVPVHALLKVSGDMQQPDISFDLEFPTLTQDTYRKVKSIVSTEEMMNRQIIYLLALNRFYTPDYMASTTKGNELVSVASSTISSQLTSMLGQLSDNWTIAPNIRSDRGDFSDMEVDLALSSYLLDNRLLFNGNFGYRDNAMNNNNSFIGDFDLEYLLNKSGNIRLKAYNRYNDQNYYLRSAQTTQGVGVVFKRDFDDIFSFWKRLRRKYKQKKASKEKGSSSTVEPAAKEP
ncbi:MAG: translocation/assembly module TamB [Lachnospiraceae bacterium]|nr:translocation/assembly module TamB [Lachnospiraceae bacterium]